MDQRYQGPNFHCQVYASSERAGGTQRVDINLQVSVPGRGAGIHLENTHPELSIKPFFWSPSSLSMPESSGKPGHPLVAIYLCGFLSERDAGLQTPL